jgi:hypothetical protein
MPLTTWLRPRSPKQSRRPAPAPRPPLGVLQLEDRTTPTALSFTSTDYAAGSYPISLAVGDFNQDGKQDFATSNASAASVSVVSVLLGNGNGTFAPKTDYPMGSWQDQVVVADVNGDGRQDLVTASYTGNSVSVLLGNGGNGTFAPAITHPVGGQLGSVISVSVGDFNSDGKADLVLGNLSQNGVSVLLGNGDGTFGQKTTYSVGHDVRGIVAIGDFDADGDQDLAAPASNDGTVSILRGNGDGTFGQPTDYTLDTHAIHVVVGDFNTDGKPDLVVPCDYGVAVLQGNGDGTFAPAVFYALGGSTHPRSVAVGDFNADGKQDLVTANILDEDHTFLDAGASASVLLGNGDGTFAPPVRFTTAGSPVSVAVGDFNADGKQDFATACQRGVVSVLLNGPVVDATGDLLVAGTSAANVFSFNRVGGQIQVVRDGITLATYGGSGRIRVFGGTGDDSFTVNAAPAGGISINGQLGADNYVVNLGDLAGSVAVADTGGLDGWDADPNGLPNMDTVVVNGTAGNDVLDVKGGVVTRGNPVVETVTFTGTERATVDGGAGDDTITDPASADLTLLGGAGNDTIVIADTTGSVWADGGAGSDTYVIFAASLQGLVTVADTGPGGTNSVTVVGTAGNDTIVQAGGEVFVNGSTITLATGVTDLTIDGGGGAGDTFTLSGTPTVAATVAGVLDLVVTGTDGNDQIVFAPQSGGGVVARMNGAVVSRSSSATRLVANGLGGNDDIQVAAGITTPAWLYGGAGNDRLGGGSGSDILVGGDGGDLLTGGSGRDLLIGGAGADRVVGNGDDDIVIGGSTAYDAPTAAHQTFLAAVMSIWSGELGYADRVAVLRDGLLRADGTSEVRVYDDGAEDVVTGSAGQDWFLVQLESGAGLVRDKVTDLSASEFAADLSFINGVLVG